MERSAPRVASFDPPFKSKSLCVNLWAAATGGHRAGAYMGGDCTSFSCLFAPSPLHRLRSDPSVVRPIEASLHASFWELAAETMVGKRVGEGGRDGLAATPHRHGGRHRDWVDGPQSRGREQRRYRPRTGPPDRTALALFFRCSVTSSAARARWFRCRRGTEYAPPLPRAPHADPPSNGRVRAGVSTRLDPAARAPGRPRARQLEERSRWAAFLSVFLVEWSLDSGSERTNSFQNCLSLIVVTVHAARQPRCRRLARSLTSLSDAFSFRVRPGEPAMPTIV